MLTALLRLIPAPLHRFLYRAVYRCRVIYWRWRRPLVLGCRVLALDDAGRVLLVRHSYGSGKWAPPGGGIGRGEEPVVAACRELAEETGVVLLGARQVLCRDEVLHGARNRVHVVVGRAQGSARPDGREIVEIGWFAPASLPVADMPAAMPRLIAMGLASSEQP